MLRSPFYIPHRLWRLRAFTHIKSTDNDTLSANKFGDVQINVPMQPSPESLAMPNWRIRVLFKALNIHALNTDESRSLPCEHSTANAPRHLS
jgi:hypothetical protein